MNEAIASVSEFTVTESASRPPNLKLPVKPTEWAVKFVPKIVTVVRSGELVKLVTVKRVAEV